MGISAGGRKNGHASLLIIIYSIFQLDGNDTFAVCGVGLQTHMVYVFVLQSISDEFIEQIIVDMRSETKLCYMKQLNLIGQFKYIERQQQLG